VTDSPDFHVLALLGVDVAMPTPAAPGFGLAQLQVEGGLAVARTGCVYERYM
jgi:hypothetical protein